MLELSVEEFREKLVNVDTTDSGTTSFTWESEEHAKKFFEFASEEMDATGCRTIIDREFYTRPEGGQLPYELYKFCSDEVICLEIDPSKPATVVFKNLGHGPAD